VLVGQVFTINLCSDHYLWPCMSADLMILLSELEEGSHNYQGKKC